MARYQEFPHSNKKYILIPLGIGVVIFAVIGIVSYFLIFGSPTPKYNEAINAYNAGDYKSAAEQFDKLGDFRDSRTRSKDCITRMHYANAQTAFANGDYETAKQEFLAAGDFESAPLLAQECDRAAHYAKGASLGSAGDFDAAIEEYKTSGYKDCNDKISELYVKKGDKALEANDYDKAVEAYKQAATFKDSTEPLQDGYYRLGSAAESANNLKDAATYFKEAGEYKDASDRLKAVYYNLGTEALSKNDFSNAAEYLKNASGYKDANSKGKEAFYSYGTQLLNAKDYKGASEYFKLAGDFKDSKTKANESLYNYGISLLQSKSFADAMLVFESCGSYKSSKELLKVSTAEAYAQNNKLSEAAKLYKSVSKKTKVSGFNVQARKSHVIAWAAIDKIAKEYYVVSNDITCKKTWYTPGMRHRKTWSYIGIETSQGILIKYVENGDGTFNITGRVRWARFTKYSDFEPNVGRETHQSDFQFSHVKKFPSTIKLSGGAKLKYKKGTFTVTYSKKKGSIKYKSRIRFR